MITSINSTANPNKMKRVNPDKLKELSDNLIITQAHLIDSGWMTNDLYREIRQLSKQATRVHQMMLVRTLTLTDGKLNSLLEVQLEITARINLAHYTLHTFAAQDMYEECEMVKDYLDQLELIYIDIIHDNYALVANVDDVNIIHQFRAISFEATKKSKQNEDSSK